MQHCGVRTQQRLIHESDPQGYFRRSFFYFIFLLKNTPLAYHIEKRKTPLQSCWPVKILRISSQSIYVNFTQKVDPLRIFYRDWQNGPRSNNVSKFRYLEVGATGVTVQNKSMLPFLTDVKSAAKHSEPFIAMDVTFANLVLS